MELIEKKTVETIPVLLGKNGDQWYGWPTIMKHLKNVTSVCGISHFQLYEKTLKEYHRHRSIYDMHHNAPFLLQCKILALSKTCNMLTVPSSERAIESVLHSLDVSLGAKNLIEGRRYPVLMPEVMDAMMEMLDQIFQYMILPDGANASLYEVKAVYKRNFTIDFYSNWQLNVINPKPWITSCLEGYLSLVPEGNKIIVSNIMDRSARRMANDKPVIITSYFHPGPIKRARLKLIELWKKLITE